MKSFIVYNAQGKILRTGTCQNSTLQLQAQNGEFVMEGSADDVTQKVSMSGKSRRILNKTAEEIEADTPKLSEPKDKDRLALITNEQHQNLLNRITALENNQNGK